MRLHSTQGSLLCSPKPCTKGLPRHCAHLAAHMKPNPREDEGCCAQGWGPSGSVGAGCAQNQPVLNTPWEPATFVGSGTGTGSTSRLLCWPEHAALPLGRDRHGSSAYVLSEQLCLNSLKLSRGGSLAHQQGMGKQTAVLLMASHPSCLCHQLWDQHMLQQ